MDVSELSWLAILVTAIMGFVVSGIWYRPIAAQARFAATAGVDHVYSQSSWARLAGVNQTALVVLLAGLREMLR